MSKALMAAGRISMIYAVFAGLWIAFSDMALESSVTNARHLSSLQTLKGELFVVVTALMLFILVLRTFRSLDMINQLDPLTGLLNHDMFRAELQKKLQQCSPTEYLAVAYLDVDNFAELNQRLGFERADKFLQEFASRLEGHFTANHLIGRFPPDQFAVAFLAEKSQPAVEGFVTQLKALFGQTILRDYPAITCTVGVSLGPDDGGSAKALMSAAAQALATAKQGRRDGIEFFSHELSEQESKKQRLLRDLRQVLDTGGLSLVYQPQFRLDTRELSGVEVLIRWQHPQHGFISPDVFIPLAEESGLCDRISAFVISQAAQELSQAQLLGRYIGRVSVNISAVEFNSEQLMGVLLERIQAVPQLQPYLQIEITETATLTDIGKSAGIIRWLKQHGLRFSVDDFGTGYTSLAMLKDLPIDEIKIDRSFINDLCNDNKAEIIIEAMVAMTHNFGVNVVAEGIETQAQYDLLRQLGCHEAQGYLLAMPMDINNLLKQIRRDQPSLAEQG